MPVSARALVRTRRRRATTTAVAVLVLVAGGGTWLATRDDATAAAPTDTLVAATSGTVRDTVTATGTIEPARRADLGFAVSGTVTEVPVTVGQVVTAGQELARVDDEALAAAVETAQAQVTAASAQVTADAAASASQLAAARAQLAKAQADLDAARTSLAAASLTSTLDGTVAAVTVAVGDRVGGGGSGSAASTGGTTGAAVTVISTDAYVVDAGVGSADLARVTKGLQAEITPTGATQRVFGTVSSVGIVASTSNGTGTGTGTAAASQGSATFPVEVAVTGSPAGLYAGGTASVVVVVSQTPDVLTVPTAALHSAGGGTVVYQRRAGKQVSTPVTVGTSYGARTAVTAGLAAGDQVLVSTQRVPGATGRTGGAGGGGGGGGLGGFGGGGFGGGGTGGGGPGAGTRAGGAG